MQISGFQFGGVAQNITQTTGRTVDRIQSSPTFGFITLTKKADTSSPAWFGFAHGGKVIDNIEIDFTTASTPAATYQKIKLTNVFVSHFSQEHEAGAAHLGEVLALAYGSVQIIYTPRCAKNVAGSPTMAGYNLATASKL